MRTSRLGTLAAALGVMAVASCGGDPADPSEVRGVGEVRAGSVAQLANCADWKAGTVEERLATIEDVRSQINLEDAPVEQPALSDEAAYEFFQQACEPGYAESFRLYKIYARAAAFQSLR